MSKASASKEADNKARLSETNIWSRFEKEIPATRPPKRKFRWVVDAVLPITLSLLAGIIVLLPTSLPTEGRLSLFAFAIAVILWSTTSLNAAYVALAAVILLILSGGSDQEELFEALESDVIWLMIGAFILGGAVQQTGLAARLTQIVVSKAHTVGKVFWLMTTILDLLRNSR